MSCKSPTDALMELARSYGLKDMRGADFSTLMDKNDQLKEFRDRFHFPRRNSHSTDQGPITRTKQRDNPDNGVIYMCGHSLGLQPRRTKEYVERVLNDWKDWAVESHFIGFLPATTCENYSKSLMASLVGCDSKDVTIMNGLTVNLHLMMTYFYKPTTKRHKILIEHGAFTSDLYAAKSQLYRNGFNSSSLISLKPRKNEHLLRIDDILKVIEEEGDQIELILWPGVQYYTGQKFPIETIIRASRIKGCKIGLDLAHSVGNVSVDLGHWKPDFAVWCTYKYLNAGAGAFGAAYVNEKYTRQGNESAFLKGWWGNDPETRFQMKEDFEPGEGADRFKLSNASPVLAAMLLASLQIFEEAKLENLHRKRYLLTGYLEFLLKSKLPTVEIITPSDPEQRGNQLSILIEQNAKSVEKEMLKRGVMCDSRAPSVLRIGPCPLYNNFTDVRKCVDILGEVLTQLSTN